MLGLCESPTCRDRVLALLGVVNLKRWFEESPSISTPKVASLMSRGDLRSRWSYRGAPAIFEAVPIAVCEYKVLRSRLRIPSLNRSPPENAVLNGYLRSIGCGNAAVSGGDGNHRGQYQIDTGCGFPGAKRWGLTSECCSLCGFQPDWVNLHMARRFAASGRRKQLIRSAHRKTQTGEIHSQPK